MDTVTEGRMAIAMAELGGIGIIHRFLSVEDQVHEVLKVKRFEGFTIENPYTISQIATLRELRATMKDYGVGGLLVTDENKKLIGIITNRDIIFEHDANKKVQELMTPREKLVTAPIGTPLDQAKEILARHKIEKLPLVDSDDRLSGLITSKDIVKVTEFPGATKDSKGRLRVGAAIGVKDDLPRARALIEAGVDALVIDIAHGHSAHVLRMVENLRKTFGNIEIIAGNVATPEGARDLARAGCDAIKVGVDRGRIALRGSWLALVCLSFQLCLSAPRPRARAMCQLLLMAACVLAVTWLKPWPLVPRRLWSGEFWLAPKNLQA